MDSNKELNLLSYSEQVLLLKEHQRNTSPEEILAIYLRAQQQMAQSKIGEDALLPGSIAPGFVLPDALGYSVSLKDALAKGNVVLTFYRGAWCPFCNLQLKLYQEMLPQIKSL